MIYKDISFIEKVLAEQKHLKSKCVHKLDSLREYKGQLLNVNYVKGHPYYSAHFPGEEKNYLGRETHPDVLGIRECRLYETILSLAEGNIEAAEYFLSHFIPVSNEEVVKVLPKHYIPSTLNGATECSDARTLLLKDLQHLKDICPSPHPESLQISTIDGSFVRSRSESLVYNLLGSYGLDFFHELPIYRDGRYFYPDFTILHPFEPILYIIEHLGLWFKDDIGEKYSSSFYQKTLIYEEMGFSPGVTLLLSFENSKSGPDLESLAKTIEQTFGRVPTAQARKIGITAEDFLKSQTAHLPMDVRKSFATISIK